MKQSGFVKWLIVVAIIVIANMLLNYLVSTIFDKPIIENICSKETLANDILDKQTCSEKKGVWEKVVIEELDTDISYCNLYHVCQSKFDKERSEFETRSFFVLVGFGLIILIMSFLIKIPTLSIAFGLTSFVDFTFASIRYWEYSTDLMKVGILFVSLLILILIAITRYRHLNSGNETI